MAKTATKGREVAPTRKPGAMISADMSAPLPAFMQEDIGKDKHIDREDMDTPRVKLMQSLSKELDTYDHLRQGEFFHVAAEESLGTRFLAVPVYYEKRFLLWNPIDSGGGILARADDGIHWSPPNGKFTVKLDKKDGGHTVEWATAKTVAESGLADWGSMYPDDPNSPPAATKMLNYLLAFPEHPELDMAVLTFQRSSVKVGRKFNTKLKTIRAPMFGLVFEFSSFKDKNRKGQEFFNVNVTGAGRIMDEKVYKQFREVNQGLMEAGLNLNLDERYRDDEVPEDGDDKAAVDVEPTTAARGGGGRQGGKARY